MEQTKRKIVFIDDDEMLATVNALILKEKGFDVELRFSLKGIGKYLAQCQPDLIVLDVEIGTENGIEALPEIKKILPHTPILFISSHIAGKEIKKAMQAGGEHYIKKPFDTDELEAYIYKLLPAPHKENIDMEEGYQLRTKTRELYHDDILVKKLSIKEYELFALLYAHKGNIVSRDTILKEVWADTTLGSSSLNNLISKLRTLLSKTGGMTIETIAGEGYMLKRITEKTIL